MNKNSISEISMDEDEYPEITQSDLDRAIFRKGLKPVSKKQITIALDTDIINYFKSKAGDNYQILINDTLKNIIAA